MDKTGSRILKENISKEKNIEGGKGNKHIFGYAFNKINNKVNQENDGIIKVNSINCGQS